MGWFILKSSIKFVVVCRVHFGHFVYTRVLSIFFILEYETESFGNFSACKHSNHKPLNRVAYYSYSSRSIKKLCFATNITKHFVFQKGRLRLKNLKVLKLVSDFSVIKNWTFDIFTKKLDQYWWKIRAFKKINAGQWRPSERQKQPY